MHDRFSKQLDNPKWFTPMWEWQDMVIRDNNWTTYNTLRCQLLGWKVSTWKLTSNWQKTPQNVFQNMIHLPISHDVIFRGHSPHHFVFAFNTSSTATRLPQTYTNTTPSNMTAPRPSHSQLTIHPSVYHYILSSGSCLFTTQQRPLWKKEGERKGGVEGRQGRGRKNSC